MAWKKQTVALIVGMIVTLVWAASVLAEIFIPEFSMNPFIHGIMGAIVAFFFKDSLQEGINIKIGGKK